MIAAIGLVEVGLGLSDYRLLARTVPCAASASMVCRPANIRTDVIRPERAEPLLRRLNPIARRRS